MLLHFNILAYVCAAYPSVFVHYATDVMPSRVVVRMLLIALLLMSVFDDKLK